MRVYHLLSEEWALENINKMRLKVSLLEDLNDPFEFLALDTSNPIIAKTLPATRYDLGKTSGVLCFSERWLNPVLWSHYGDGHKGIALGFEIPDFIEGEPLLIKVSYTSERINYSESDIEKFDEQDMHKVLATKYAHWKYEEEVRVFTSIEEKDKETGLYYVPFSDNLSLVEVILGVRCKVPPVCIRRKLKNYSQSVKIIESKLDERTFSVVKKYADEFET